MTIELKSIFDKYYQKEVTYPSNKIDAVVGFFLKRGFDDQASRSSAIVLLNQSKVDQVDVFELIDKLKGLTDAQLSQILTDVINANRDKTSSLGFKLIDEGITIESRNIRV